MRVEKTQDTWPCIKELIEFLSSRRDVDRPIALRLGINHAIVFYAACYVEGVLETTLKALLRRRREIYNKIDVPDFEIRKTINTLFNALEEDLQTRISRATGVDAYETLIELLTGTRIGQSKKVRESWEGIQVLFQFRNVLAHGRAISASRLSAYWIKEPWQENFSGGYKRAEEYLFKGGLLECKFMDSDQFDLYFTDAVADHFWGLARSFITHVIATFEAPDIEAVSRALSAAENEAKNGGIA